MVQKVVSFWLLCEQRHVHFTWEWCHDLRKRITLTWFSRVLAHPDVVPLCDEWKRSMVDVSDALLEKTDKKVTLLQRFCSSPSQTKKITQEAMCSSNLMCPFCDILIIPSLVLRKVLFKMSTPVNGKTSTLF